MIRRNLIRSIVFAPLALAAVFAHGEQWIPKAPVHVVVPFDAGSTPDLLARLVSERLGARLGQPIVVDNKSGASGNIGTNAIAKAQPDGQTIGVSIAGPLGVNALLFTKMPYDPTRDIELISIAASQPGILVASNKLTVKASDLLDLLKKSPKAYSFASIGFGSASHLAMEVLVASSGADLVHAPYRGSSAALTSLLSGETNLAILPAAAVMPHVKAGRIRALAVAAPKRSALVPDLPTMVEAGLPDVKADAWIGFVAPAGTPAVVLQRFHAEITKILAEPAIKEKLKNQYMEPVGNTPAEFRNVVSSEVARWKPVIEKHKITLD